MNSSTGEWKKFIMGLTVPADEIDYPLYHLTENKPDNLNWVSNKKPRTTKKTDSNTPPHPICSEPLPPRISTAPTLEGCFGGIYPYLANTFQDKGIKEKEFYLYQCSGKKLVRKPYLYYCNYKQVSQKIPFSISDMLADNSTFLYINRYCFHFLECQ
jgi:hypothetical protein